MSIPRYHTVGAVAPDPGSLGALDERLGVAGVGAESLLVLARRRDEATIRVMLPEARVRVVEAGLTRAQWFEFASAYLGVTAVSVLMGAVHLPTGIVVQSVMTLISVAGIILYHRRPKVEKRLLAMGLPQKLAADWQESFPTGYALALVTVPGGLFEEAESAFLEDDGLKTPLAVDRRPVL